MSKESRSLPALVSNYAPGILLAGLALVNPWMEQTMARHMGLELPGLFILGWFAASRSGRRLTHALEPWNVNGLPGLLFALLVTGFWMVPAALDHAVLNDAVAMTKVASLVLAGLLTGASWASAGTVIQSFFILNWFWMTLAAGLLYQEAPQQLCSVYLADQQGDAGRATVAWALAGLGLWLIRIVLASRHLEESRPLASKSP